MSITEQLSVIGKQLNAPAEAWEERAKALKQLGLLVNNIEPSQFAQLCTGLEEIQVCHSSCITQKNRVPLHKLFQTHVLRL